MASTNLQFAAVPTDDHDAAAMLAAIVESSEDAILSKTLQGVISTWNRGAERLFGYTAEEVVGRSVTILIPPDRLDEEPAILARIHAGERVDHFETVRRRKDGTLLDISLTISPIRNATGEIIGASKIARDIGDRKRALERQKLLLREMQHRIKNLFALTGGLVSLAARSAATPAALAVSIRERLAALSAAHELTLPNLESDTVSESATSLRSLLDRLLAPYQDGAATRLTFTGDDVAIGPRQLTNVALLMHELVTNSAKYGALSSPSGTIAFTVEPEEDAIHLTWAERGGPRVHRPDGSSGFGTRLETMVQESLHATLAKEWNADGLIARLTIPVGSLSQ